MIYIMFAALIAIGLFTIAVVTLAEKRHISFVESLAGILKPHGGSDD